MVRSTADTAFYRNSKQKHTIRIIGEERHAFYYEQQRGKNCKINQWVLIIIVVPKTCEK